MVTNQSLQNILLPALSTTPSQSERRPVLRRRRVAPPPAPPLALLPHPHASAGRGSAQSAAAPVPSCGGATGPTPASVSSTPICGANRHRSSAARLCPPPAANSLARYLALANVQQQRQCLCPLLAWQLHQQHPPVAPTAGIHKKRGHDEAVATSNSVKAPSPPKPLGTYSNTKKYLF